MARQVGTQNSNTRPSWARWIPGGREASVSAWSKSWLCLGIGAEPKTEIGPRADKNYATQVFTEMSIGATRMELAKVVEIICA